MPDLNPRNMAAIRSGNYTPQQLHEALVDIVNSVGNVSDQTNASPVGKTPAPTGHSAISVKGGAGIFDVALTDNSPQNRGKEHFFDYSTDPNFSTFHTKSLGPAKNWRGALGSQTLHFRSYTQMSTSAPSEMLYHPAVSGSAAGEPEMQKGQGSGTGTQGYGSQPFNTVRQPIR